MGQDTQTNDTTAEAQEAGAGAVAEPSWNDKIYTSFIHLVATDITAIPKYAELLKCIVDLLVKDRIKDSATITQEKIRCALELEGPNLDLENNYEERTYDDGTGAINNLTSYSRKIKLRKNLLAAGQSMTATRFETELETCLDKAYKEHPVPTTGTTAAGASASTATGTST